MRLDFVFNRFYCSKHRHIHVNNLSYTNNLTMSSLKELFLVYILTIEFMSKPMHLYTAKNMQVCPHASDVI